MQHISLILLTESVPVAAQVLADCGVFNPETTEQLPEPIGDVFRQLFNIAHSRLDKISALVPLKKPATVVERVIDLSELEQVNKQLGSIWLELSQHEEKLHHLTEQKTALKHLLDNLKIFSMLNVDLKQFQKKARFLNLHIGTIPLAQLEHLKEAIALAEHFIEIFHSDEQSASIVVAGTLEHQEKVHAILEHADFQVLNIPPEFHSHPQQVHADLIAQLDKLQQQTEIVLNKEKALGEKNQEILENAYNSLNNAAAYAELTDTLKGRGKLALIEGWIPKADLLKLETALDEQLKTAYVLTSRSPTASEYQQVPSLIKHHRLLAPFTTLVKNYGIPRYGEFDPTLLFSITFILMFGTMFGDVGHGALIVGAGWYWRKQLKTFTAFFIAAGSSSILFGFLYGSIFGFEEIVLPALWLSPIHNPILMLKLALYWGMAFICLATLITILNNWKEGNYASAIFNNTGLAGLFLYFGGFYAAEKWMIIDSFDINQQLAIVIPLLMILGYKWQQNKLPLGERILVTLIEGFESILNYLANTLSFLRVAAFSLNHAALAIAVFTLANMIGNPGDWIMIILGNLFIVIVEGGIVTIQVLRLEYYEGFSRFFRGDGRVFIPLRKGLG